MKIYLCSGRPEEKTHQWVSSMAVFNGMVEDSEATSIVCDNFLSSFTYEEMPPLLAKISSKMRLNSELVIIHTDIEVLSRRLFREEIDTDTINNILFANGAIKSVCSAQDILSLIPENLQITHKHFDMATSNITVKIRRVK